MKIFLCERNIGKLEINYKIFSLYVYGSLLCSRIGCLQVEIFGESSEASLDSNGTLSENFQCGIDRRRQEFRFARNALQQVT